MLEFIASIGIGNFIALVAICGGLVIADFRGPSNLPE